MSNTVKQLGFIPTNRGEYDTTGQTRYYKDNVVQYGNGSYICTPVGYSSDNPTAYTTDAPYQDGDTELNPNWKLMASVGLVDDEPIAGSDNLVKSGGVAKINLLKAYFTSSKVPLFSPNSDGSVNVTLQASTLRIYNVRGEKVAESTIEADQTYEVGATQSIVMDISTGTISVLNIGDEGNYITLFSNAFNSYFGILAPYYYQSKFKSVDNAINEETNNRKLMQGLYAYFGGNQKPSIKVNNTSISITTPNQGLTIKNDYGRNVFVIASSVIGSQTFNLTYNDNDLAVLVYDLDATGAVGDAYVKVISPNTEGNYLVLLGNCYGELFGLLAPYYFVDIANKRELFGYFQSGVSPVIDIVDDVVSITMPNKKLYIHNRDNTRVKEVAASVFDGETAGSRKYTLKVSNLNSAELIYDFGTNTASVVAPTELNTNCVILLGNTYGCLYGILAGYYYYNKVAVRKPITAYFVGIKEPNITTDGTNIYFTIPSSGFRLYFNDGTTQSITSANGVTFTIPGLSKLVYDLDDSTVKVVTNTTIGNYYELLINAYGNVSGLFAPAYTFATNTILNLYKNQTEVQILQNMKKSNTRYDVQGIEPLVLLHMSDLHEDTDNLQRIIDYYKMYSSKIDDIINTGDNVNFDDGYGSITAVSGSENILTTIGNHDVLNSPSTYADLPVYNLEIKDYVSNWGVTQPVDAATNGHCYYYKDYTDKKIRLIVLDNFTQDMNAQVTWLSSVLADAITNNLSVVCAIHFPCPMNLVKETTFCSLDGSGVFEDATQEVLLSAVDTFINNGGKFVCWLTGHTHQNLFGLVTGHTNQVCINIAASTDNRNSDSCERVAGTKSQDCFNLFSVDLNTKTIELHRLGVEYDRYLRHIGTMCYNYETKVLVYNN